MKYKMHKTKFKQTEIGMIPEEWEVGQLGNLCEITSSKRIFLKEYVSNGIPFYRSKEIILLANNQIISDTLFISKERFEEISNKFGSPKEGDLLMTSVGTLGVPYIVKKNETFYFKDGNLMWFRSFKPKLKNKFLYYWIKSPIGQQQLDFISIGSTQRALTIDSVKRMKISFPKIGEQEFIAKILSDLDSKIELNQQMNKTLEEIGKAIFKHWFVDFEFPNEEGKPYKSSGGETVYNEELGKEIPKGWRVGNYGDFLKFEKGIEPGAKEYSNGSGHDKIPFYRVADLATGMTNVFVKESVAKKIANEEDILVSFDGTPGRVAFGIKGSFSSGIRKVYDENNLFSNSFIFFFMKSDFVQRTIEIYSKGTTILHAGDAIAHLHAAIPDNKILKKFSELINHIFYSMVHNTKHLTTLSQIRDALLPKLMSGKIRVPLEGKE